MIKDDIQWLFVFEEGISIYPILRIFSQAYGVCVILIVYHKMLAN